jgi:hypothetical protein
MSGKCSPQTKEKRSPEPEDSDAVLAWISQTRTYQGGEPGRHLHFSGTQDLVCW